MRLVREMTSAQQPLPVEASRRRGEPPRCRRSGGRGAPVLRLVAILTPGIALAVALTAGLLLPSRPVVGPTRR